MLVSSSGDEVMGHPQHKLATKGLSPTDTMLFTSHKERCNCDVSVVFQEAVEFPICLCWLVRWALPTAYMEEVPSAFSE